MSAVTTEHFVLQTAISATINEGGARSSMYLMFLSSALVALGFSTDAPEAFAPLAFAILPAVVILGVMTTLRLVDIAAENMQAHIGIARLRKIYRSLGGDAAQLFSVRSGRWPEGQQEPSLWAGAFVGFITSAASMVAMVNAIVGGAALTLLTRGLMDGEMVVPLIVGAVGVAVLFGLFFAYQRVRIDELARLAKPE